jgi:hypothetical protein
VQPIENVVETEPVKTAPEDVLVEPQEEALEGASEEGAKKRVKKKVRKLTEADVEPPKPSIWPLALAIAIVITMGGAAFNPIFLGIGGVLILICVAGWILERRH